MPVDEPETYSASPEGAQRSSTGLIAASFIRAATSSVISTRIGAPPAIGTVQNPPVEPPLAMKDTRRPSGCQVSLETFLNDAISASRIRLGSPPLEGTTYTWGMTAEALPIIGRTSKKISDPAGDH